MSVVSELTKLQDKVYRVEETLIPLRELASKLREDVRKQGETFAYTNRQEKATREVSVETVKLEISSHTLLGYVDDEINKLLKPLEKEREILSSVQALLNKENNK